MNYTSQQVQQRLDAARQQFDFANIIRVVVDEDAYAYDPVTYNTIVD